MDYTIKEITKNKDISIKVLRYYETDINILDLSILTDKEAIQFESFKSKKRQQEFYFARVLWKSFGIENKIKYKLSGKPILKSAFISISHSNHQVAIALSTTKEVGMDIELRSDKIQRIKSKYLHKDEDYTIIEDLTKIWTIKEAVYKLYDSKLIFFKDHIIIESLNPKVQARVLFSHKTFEPQITTFELDNNFYLSYAQ